MPSASQTFLEAMRTLGEQPQLELVDGDTATELDPARQVLIFSGPAPESTRATYLDLSNGKINAYNPEVRRWLEGLYRVWLDSDRDGGEFVHYFRFWESFSKAKAPATYVLIAICVLLYGLTSLLGGNHDLMPLVRFGAANSLLIGQGEWWRIVGSNFLHIGPVHLLVNMYALYAVGREAERFFGTGPFLGLYALAGVAGSLASYFTTPANVVSAGASGAIFGLFGAAVVLSYKKDLPRSVAQSMRSVAIQNLGLNLVVAFTMPNIGHAAHLGGCVTGALFAALVPTATRPRSKALVWALTALAVPYGLAELVTLYHAFQ